MLDKIENWAMNVFAGKLVTRIAIVVAGFLLGPASSFVLAKTGVNLHLDATEVQAAVTGALTAAFEWIKAKRAANPASVTVQTDLSKVAPVAPVVPA